MKKLIIIALVLISSTQLFAQNNNNRFQYNKEGLSQNDINIREAYIKSVPVEEAKLVAQQNQKVESQVIATEVSAKPTQGPSTLSNAVASTPAPVVAPVAPPVVVPQVVAPKKVVSSNQTEVKEFIIDNSSISGTRKK